MTDYFPFLIAILIILVTFTSAMKNGVVKLLASGLAALVLIIVLVMGVQFLPLLADHFLDIELTWKVTMGVSCVLAILTYTISRFAAGWFFKKLLGPESFLHNLSDGLPGGILSLFPSLVIVFVLFNFVRIAGTQLELNYVASLSRDAVIEATNKLPAYPMAAKWRNRLEAVPLIAASLDLIDPFSNRLHRNMAALVIVSQSTELKGFMLDQEETSPLVALSGFSNLAREEVVSAALETTKPVELVTLPRLQEAAESFGERKELRRLKLQPVLEAFVDQIEPVVVPELEPNAIN